MSGEFSPVRPMSDATRDILQQSIEYEYQRFITLVANSRKQDVAAIDAIAQGRVWSGVDAKRLGLVDQLGGYGDAIKLAAKLAQLGEDYDVVHFDVEVGISEALGLRVQAGLARVLQAMLPASTLQNALPQVPAALKPVVAELNRIGRLSDPRNVYMYCLACAAH
jgi:protease-4